MRSADANNKPCPATAEQNPPLAVGCIEIVRCHVCGGKHFVTACPYKDPDSHWIEKEGVVNHLGNPAFWSKPKL